jgi:hypothetical protein
MTSRADVAAIVPLTRVFHRLGIKYYIGGSVASSTHGLARSTIDLDVIADIRSNHVDDLIRLLGETFYIDADMIRDAIRHSRSFNIVHLETMHKVDIFIRKDRPFDRSAWERADPGRPFEDHDEAYPLASAEDVILSKLEWYRMGDEVSERQWLDVIGVMRIQQDRLDRVYLKRWAADLNVSDLLDRARIEAESIDH